MLCHPSVNFFFSPFDKASMVRYIPRITNPRKKKKGKGTAVAVTTTLPPTDIAYFISL